LLGVERKQTAQMQGVGVIGIDRQRPLAAHLGVEVPFGPHMAKPGLIQRNRRARAWCARDCLGFSGGCPAFAAVHQRISNGPNPNL
jgi:hypothetical protein